VKNNESISKKGKIVEKTKKKQDSSSSSDSSSEDEINIESVKGKKAAPKNEAMNMFKKRKISSEEDDSDEELSE
jgi:hypothetical protein